MKIRWLDTALADIERLARYITENETGDARIVLERIFASVRTLEQFAGRGRIGRLSHTRELVIPRTPYVVMYRVTDTSVEILRVVHGAQRWPEP